MLPKYLPNNIDRNFQPASIHSRAIRKLLLGIAIESRKQNHFYCKIWATQSVYSTEPMKCLCNHCSIEIEFDESQTGQLVACPACSLDTALYQSPQTKSPIEKQIQRHDALIEAKARKRNKRVCKRCEQEVFATTLGNSYVWAPSLILLLAIPTFIFFYKLSITLIVVSVVLLIVLCSVEACPKCSSTEVVKLDTPAAGRILQQE